LRARGAAATALDTPIEREPAVNREEAGFIERALTAASELR
jgi:hypothetical protein